MKEKKHGHGSDSALDSILSVTVSTNDGTGMIPIAPGSEGEAENYASLLNLGPLGTPAAADNMLPRRTKGKEKKTDRRSPRNM